MFNICHFPTGREKKVKRREGAGGTGEAKFRLIHSEEASKLTSALYPNPNIPNCRQLKVLGQHKYLSWFEIGTGWRDFGTIFLIIDSLGTSIYLLHGILVTNTNITLMNGMVRVLGNKVCLLITFHFMYWCSQIQIIRSF